MGAALQPGLYRCVVAIAPVTDLNQLIGQQFFTEFGDINRDRIIGIGSGESLRSPLDLADTLTVPVLLIHGRQDYTVPASHSEVLEQRLRAAGRPVQALYLDHADHFFGRYEDRLDCLRALDFFLATYLGGPSSPAPS
jgi:dipeptidyl aminopeptidase/acylaminoacyl peptidase